MVGASWSTSPREDNGGAVAAEKDEEEKVDGQGSSSAKGEVPEEEEDHKGGGVSRIQVCVYVGGCGSRYTRCTCLRLGPYRQHSRTFSELPNRNRTQRHADKLSVLTKMLTDTRSIYLQ
eukprot:RCo012617